MRRDEILSPNREPRSYRSFSSTRFSPTLPGETPRVGVSSRWGDAAQAAQDSDDFKEFVQQLNRLGHEYYERQVTEGAAAVDAECGQLVAAAEADGEEAWAVALSAVHEEWEEVQFCQRIRNTAFAVPHCVYYSYNNRQISECFI